MSYIYPTVERNKTQFKVYFLYQTHKIYLGAFPSLAIAESVLREAEAIMLLPPGPPNFPESHLNYKKVVCLCNLRDHHTYIKNPIYLFPTYFSYYLSKDMILLFDLKDLFFFSTYKIYKRGNYLYTQDHISQQNLLSRFDIQNHSVLGKDYYFKNNNCYDFRRENLVIINHYKGVSKKEKGAQTLYITSIYTTKNIILGHYASEIEAAIAYNKGIDLLRARGIEKNFVPNEIPFLTKSEYKQIYDKLSISLALLEPHNKHKRITSNKLYRGICKDKNSFKALIGYQKKQIYLGNYPTEKRAAQAYNYASFYLYGRQGYINPITPVVYDPDTPRIAQLLAKHITSKQPNIEK